MSATDSCVVKAPRAGPISSAQCSKSCAGALAAASCFERRAAAAGPRRRCRAGRTRAGRARRAPGAIAWAMNSPSGSAAWPGPPASARTALACWRRGPAPLALDAAARSCPAAAPPRSSGTGDAARTRSRAGALRAGRAPKSGDRRAEERRRRLRQCQRGAAAAAERPSRGLAHAHRAPTIASPSRWGCVAVSAHMLAAQRADRASCGVRGAACRAAAAAAPPTRSTARARRERARRPSPRERRSSRAATSAPSRELRPAGAQAAGAQRRQAGQVAAASRADRLQRRAGGRSPRA